jgi:uncharacterized protein YndB with AHSA1/START domain
MDLQKNVDIKSSPEFIFRSLLSPDALKNWWQCQAVVEASVGGVWAIGWGENENNIGNTVVITGFIQEITPDTQLTIFIDPISISFTLAATDQGTSLTISQFNYPDNGDAESSLATWVDAMGALKVYAEKTYPLSGTVEEAPDVSSETAIKENKEEVSSEVVEPAPDMSGVTQQVATISETGQRATVNVNRMNNPAFTNYPSKTAGSIENILDNRGSKSGLYILNKPEEISHNVESVPSQEKKEVTSEPSSGFKVLEDGGFPITDPWGVIKSWKKEHGFGYVDHSQIGDVMFDYDGCDFEPAPGDKVLLLKLKKTWNGKPKCKRIACPAKGSRVDK